VAALDYLAFDCDNHYYEAHDAFTRHVPRAMQPRCVQWAEIDDSTARATLTDGATTVSLAFGFSRGAYTARSLSGLISKCGIMKLGDAEVIGRLRFGGLKSKLKTTF